MRISFRTRILLALTLTVAALLGATLLIIERIFAREIQELIHGQVDRTKGTFDKLLRESHAGLARGAEELADSPQIRASLEAPDSPGKLAGLARYELENRRLRPDLLIIAPKNAPPARLIRGREELESHPVVDAIEARLLERVRTEERDASAFLLVEGRLFQAVAAPIHDGPRFRGALVLGTAIGDDFLKPFLAKDDRAGFVVDSVLVVSSLREDQRPPASEAIRSRGASTHCELAMAGEPYHGELLLVSADYTSRPTYTVIFVSVAGPVHLRDTIRAWMLITAAAGLLLSLLLGVRIAHSISAPVQALVAGTGRIARGDYCSPVIVRSRDELGALAAAFNRMAGDLATKEKVRSVLNKVVAPEVAEELVRSELKLGGEQVRATLLFADLRGFTALTRGMAPHAIVALLNEFMTAMSREIFECKGIVDKYVGDEVIGLFGVPKSYGHDAFAAIEAAYRMGERLATLNGERAGRGEKPLAMGIGIHTGDVVAGCMGSEQLMSYTCIGEAMNLASRLCVVAKAGQILVSEAALRDAGGGLDARPLPPVTVKGFPDPVPVYELVCVEIGATKRRRETTHGQP